MNQWDEEREEREKIRASITPTGCPWLDDGWAGGINREQLFMVAAKTGIGKTHFGVQMATAASRNGKRVFYFALEASRREIERRRLYTELHRLVKEHMPEMQMPRFREWIHQESTPEWRGIEGFAIENIAALNSKLTVKYRTGGAYSPEEFQQDAYDLVHEAPDLIVLDHLHHFLLEGMETDALKSAIRTIDKLKNEIGVPVLVLAQVRKSDSKQAKSSLSKIEDIRGTAALTDIATDVMVISRVSAEFEAEMPKGLFNPLFMHMGKSRTAPEMQKFAAVVGFDYRTGEYQPWYFLAKNRDYEDPEPIGVAEIPKWAKSAKPSALMSSFSKPIEKSKKDWNND